MNDSSKANPIALEQLTAMCQEIAALVRAGVPLPQGLSHAADELPGRLAQISRHLSSELDRGVDLATAIRSSGQPFPEFFPAMVEAGERSGRLSIALEAVAATTTRMIQMRREVILALTPAILTLLVAYLLFFGFITTVVGAIGNFYRTLRLEPDFLTTCTSYLASIPWYLQVMFPILVLFGIVYWLYRTNRADVIQTDGGGWAMSWLTSARQLLARSRHSSFCDILALLIEQRIPAPEAIRIAAAASGDRRLQQAGKDTADAIQRGASLETPLGLPPVLHWFIASSAAIPNRSPETLAVGLRRIAENYRDDAQRQMDFLKIYLPATATLVVGGTACLFYALATLLPWFRLLYLVGDAPGKMI